MWCDLKIQELYGFINGFIVLDMQMVIAGTTGILTMGSIDILQKKRDNLMSEMALEVMTRLPLLGVGGSQMRTSQLCDH